MHFVEKDIMLFYNLIHHSIMIYIHSFVLGFFISLSYKPKIKWTLLIIVIFSALFSFLYLLINEVTGQGFTRSFWFHLQENFKGGTYYPYLVFFIIKLIFYLSIFFLGFFIKIKFFNFIKTINNYSITIIFLCILIFNPSLISLAKSYQDWKTDSIINLDLKFNNVFKNNERLSDNFKKRDIILISLESFERSFYSQDSFSELNLSLFKRNDFIDFSNIEEVEGFTDWTIAGLVASNCGVPIIDQENLNSVAGSNSFYPNLNCFSDLLSKQGYNVLSIQGTDSEFAGTGNFYSVHSANEIYDLKEIYDYFPDRHSKISHWGFHDDTVFDFALDKVKFLENLKSPYSIWLNTVDTHAPNGLLSEDCKEITRNISSPFLKTIYCTDLY